MSGSDYPRPSRRTSLPSLGGTTASTGFSLPERAGASRSGQGTFRVAIPLSTACSLSVETVGSPRFLGNPIVDMPCSSTPARRLAPGPTARPCCLPCTQKTSAPATIILSWLNHTACPLAVYASLGWLPHRNARLASGCWPSLAGWDWLPIGFLQKVSIIAVSYSVYPPFPDLSWRTCINFANHN